MHPGSGNPGVAIGSSHSLSLMDFLVPSPGAALTCHSMWDVDDHHPLHLHLDACVWILHLHHKSFDLQSMKQMGCITEGPAPGSTPEQYAVVLYRNGCNGHSRLRISPCH